MRFISLNIDITFNKENKKTNLRFKMFLKKFFHLFLISIFYRKAEESLLGEVVKFFLNYYFKYV